MNVLFVCTGNTCRSPMAEKILAKKRPELNVQSAGTHALQGQPLAMSAKQLLREHGLNETHYAQLVSEELLDWADEVYTMTAQQAEELRYRYPLVKKNIQSLRPFRAIADPYGQSMEAYRVCFAELQEAISEHFVEKE